MINIHADNNINNQYRGLFSLNRESPINTGAYFPCTVNPLSMPGLFFLFCCIPGQCRSYLPYIVFPWSMPGLFSLYCESPVNAGLIFLIPCISLVNTGAYFPCIVNSLWIPGHIFLVPWIPVQYHRACFPCIRCIPVHSSSNSPGLIDITPRILSSTTWGTHLPQFSPSILQDNFKTVYTVVHYTLYIQYTVHTPITRTVYYILVHICLCTVQKKLQL